MEVVYRLLRDEFNYRPRLTRDQFFTVGFAEMKLIFLGDLIRMCCVLEANLRREKGDRGERRKPKADDITRPRSGITKTSSHRTTSIKPKSKAATRASVKPISRFLPSKVAQVPTATSPETELLRKRVQKLRSPYAPSTRPKSAQSTQSHRSTSPTHLYRNSTHHEPEDDPLRGLDQFDSRYTSPARSKSPRHDSLFTSYPRNPNDSTLHEPARFPPPKPAEKDSFLATAGGRLSMDTTINSARDRSWRSGMRSPVRSGGGYEFGKSFDRDVEVEDVLAEVRSRSRSLSPGKTRVFPLENTWVGREERRASLLGESALDGGVDGGEWARRSEGALRDGEGRSREGFSYVEREQLRRVKIVNEELRDEVTYLRSRVVTLEETMRDLVDGLAGRVQKVETDLGARVRKLERELKLLEEERSADRERAEAKARDLLLPPATFLGSTKGMLLSCLWSVAIDISSSVCWETQLPIFCGSSGETLKAVKRLNLAPSWNLIPRHLT